MQPDQRPDRPGRERQPARQQVEEHHAHRIDVRLGAGRIAPEKFRGHEAWRARHPFRLQTDQPPGQAEIGELRMAPRGEQHVGGLDVAMDDARSMCRIQGLHDLPDQPGSLERLDRPLAHQEILQARCAPGTYSISMK